MSLMVRQEPEPHGNEKYAGVFPLLQPVPHFIADRVLGHKIAGVSGVYDRADYTAQKRDALARLAAKIANIVFPAPIPTADVLPLRGAPAA